jgi:hypothetical protein
LKNLLEEFDNSKELTESYNVMAKHNASAPTLTIFKQAQYYSSHTQGIHSDIDKRLQNRNQHQFLINAFQTTIQDLPGKAS